jgi:hypothetical protein
LHDITESRYCNVYGPINEKNSLLTQAAKQYITDELYKEGREYYKIIGDTRRKFGVHPAVVLKYISTVKFNGVPNCWKSWVSDCINKDIKRGKKTDVELLAVSLENHALVVHDVAINFVTTFADQKGARIGTQGSSKRVVCLSNADVTYSPYMNLLKNSSQEIHNTVHSSYNRQPTKEEKSYDAQVRSAEARKKMFRDRPDLIPYAGNAPVPEEQEVQVQHHYHNTVTHSNYSNPMNALFNPLVYGLEQQAYNNHHHHH